MNTWNYFWYGESITSPSKKAASSILCAVAVICWFGMRLEFMLGKQWLLWGTILAAIVAALSFRWFGYLCAQLSGVELKNQLARLSHFTCAFVGSFIVSWMLIVFIAPGFVTRLVSPEAYAEAEFSKDKQNGRTACKYRLYGEYIVRHPVDYICISEDEYQRLPSNGKMLVREQTSIFGIYVQGVEPVDANKSLQPSVRKNAPSG